MKEPARGILLDDPTAGEDSTKAASESTISAETTAAETTDRKPSSIPSLKVKDGRRSGGKSSSSIETVKEEFHVFTWMSASDETHNTSPPPQMVDTSQVSPNAESPQIEVDLKEIDDFLCQKTNLHDRLTYRACPRSRKIDLYRILKQARNELIAENNADIAAKNRRKSYENKVDILNAAGLIIRFFLPAEWEDITVQKYWGALYRLLGVRTCNDAYEYHALTLCRRS